MSHQLPVRDRILEVLDRRGPTMFSELVELVDASDSAVLFALRELRNAGIARKHGHLWGRIGEQWPAESPPAAVASEESKARARQRKHDHWNRFAAQWPERVPVIQAVHAAIAAGELVPPACPVDPSHTMKPAYDWDRTPPEQSGWACEKHHVPAHPPHTEAELAEMREALGPERWARLAKALGFDV